MIKTCFTEDTGGNVNSGYPSYISSSKPRQQSEQDKFKESKDALVEEIKNDMNETDNILRKKILESLLKRPIFSIDDLVKLDYLYNDGNLRTDEEASYMEHYFATKNKRENYDHERHKINTIAFMVPFSIIFILCCVWFNNIIATPLSLLFGLIAGFIGMIVGYSINIKKAEEYCISPNDPRVKDEIAKRRTAIIAGITSGTIVGNHAKNTVKGVTNVDGWSEMK
jgi:hypothetical protein